MNITKTEQIFKDHFADLGNKVYLIFFRKDHTPISMDVKFPVIVLRARE